MKSFARSLVELYGNRLPNFTPEFVNAWIKEYIANLNETEKSYVRVIGQSFSNWHHSWERIYKYM